MHTKSSEHYKTEKNEKKKINKGKESMKMKIK